jgi:hypothetical protein
MKRALLFACAFAFACSGMPDLSSEPSRFPRTDRKTWSEEGWEGLRFGMGPGDVEVHLAKAMKLGGKFVPQDRDGDYDSERKKTFKLTGSSLEAVGEPVELTFKFFDNQLYWVEEDLDTKDDLQKAIRWTYLARNETAKRLAEPGKETDAELLQAASKPGAGAHYSATWIDKEKHVEEGVFLTVLDKEISKGRTWAYRARLDLTRSKVASEADRAVFAASRAALEAKEKKEAPARLIKEVQFFARSTVLGKESKQSAQTPEQQATALRYTKSVCVLIATVAQCDALLADLKEHPEKYEKWEGLKL